MKAHRELNWEASDSDGGTVYAARGYFIYQYRTADRVMWRLEGHGFDVINADVDELKRLAQDQYNRKRQMKAWEDYMLTHEPPA